MLDPVTITAIVSAVITGVIAIVQAIVNLIKKQPVTPTNSLGLRTP